LMHDPRPPTLAGSRWRLEWASRVDGSKRARAFIDPTTMVDRPVAGFFLWRAHESAICDLGIRETFPDDVAAAACLAELLAERDMHVRLAMIQGLIEPHLRNREFMREFVNLFEVDGTAILQGPGEIAISGAQGGLEFVMVSAVSMANVSSDKMLLPDLRAIAVPIERERKKPLLRVLRPTAGTAFSKSGLVVIAVGAQEPFPSEDVRIYWDSDLESMVGDEILHCITPTSELSLRQVGAYVSGAQSMLDRLAMPHWRYFAVKPHPSWSAHNFTTDLRSAWPLIPADAIPTPRADIQRIELVPQDGPTLRVVDDLVVGNDRTLKISLKNIFETTVPGFAKCMVQLEVVSTMADAPKSDPISMEDLVAHGLTIVERGVQIRATCAPNSAEIVVRGPNLLGGKVLRLAASDPAGRIDVLAVTM
jgi:hypothetical protein